MQIAVAAYPIDWHNRWNEYVGKLRVWVRTAAEGGAELLVFPEFAALELATLAEEANASDPARAIEALTARLKDVDDLHASLAREFSAHLLAASGPVRTGERAVVNRARLFAPEGGRGVQDQIAPDAEGREVWGLAAGAGLRVFETRLGRIGVLIGADLAAPGPAAALAHAGAEVLLAPARSGTDTAAAALAAAAAARARETGRPVALAVALGAADWAPALGRSTGAAAIFAPEAGLAEGAADKPGWTYAEVATLARAEAPDLATVELAALG